MIVAMMTFDRAEDEKLYRLVTSSWYMLTGRSRPEQTDHNDFEVWEGQSPALFVLVSRSGGTFVLTFSASNTYVKYPMAVKKN